MPVEHCRCSGHFLSCMEAVISQGIQVSTIWFGLNMQGDLETLKKNCSLKLLIGVKQSEGNMKVKAFSLTTGYFQFHIISF